MPAKPAQLVSRESSIIFSAKSGVCLGLRAADSVAPSIYHQWSILHFVGKPKQCTLNKFTAGSQCVSSQHWVGASLNSSCFGV